MNLLKMMSWSPGILIVSSFYKNWSATLPIFEIEELGTYSARTFNLTKFDAGKINIKLCRS